jgi:hypothetical protein
LGGGVKQALRARTARKSETFFKGDSGEAGPSFVVSLEFRG